MKFIVKLFPEITIKSKPVRQRLVKQLRQNLQVVLSKETEGAKVQGFWDKLEVRILPDFAADEPKVIAALQRVPGISNILKVKSYEIENIDERFDYIADICRETYAAQVDGKSFVVRVKRAGKHSFTSTDLERYIGGALLQTTGAELLALATGYCVGAPQQKCSPDHDERDCEEPVEGIEISGRTLGVRIPRARAQRARSVHEAAVATQLCLTTTF